jgi:hypothetical protein
MIGRLTSSLCIALAIGLAMPAAAQQTTPIASPPATTAPAAQRHLVVLNHRGPNFDRMRDHPVEIRAHRQKYLDLTAKGDVIASGLLRSDPPVGFVLFRQGVDEEAIRAFLEDDFAMREKIMTLEFIYWDIQMGAVGRPTQ